MTPEFSGCDWPLDAFTLGETWAGLDAEVKDRATSLASATLYRLTAYRVGGCPVTVRPSRQNGCAVLSADLYLSSMPSFYPVNIGGHWSNVWCNDLGDPRLVALPQPIGEVYDVKIDGSIISPSNYTVTNEGLAWIGNTAPPWPATQDVYLPDTEDGTFSVTYLNSIPVDGYGAIAAALLALEFAKALKAGGKGCKLPSNIVSIVRQGVSYEIAAGAFPGGKTGIREIDGFIETWNPKARGRQQVFNPSAPKVYVQR